MHTSPGVSKKNQKVKKVKQSGVGLKEVWPKTPKNDRMGRSPLISFSLRTRPGVSKKNTNQKIKNSKSQSGVGLKEVRPEPPKNNRIGKSPIISF